MERVTVYAKNGATFECDTEERLQHYLNAGWTKTAPKKGKKPPKGEESPKDEELPKGEEE